MYWCRSWHFSIEFGKSNPLQACKNMVSNFGRSFVDKFTKSCIIGCFRESFRDDISQYLVELAQFSVLIIGRAVDVSFKEIPQFPKILSLISLGNLFGNFYKSILFRSLYLKLVWDCTGLHLKWLVHALDNLQFVMVPRKHTRFPW